MNSIAGHGKLGSFEWDQNQILAAGDAKELTDYIKERFGQELDNSLTLNEAVNVALAIAEKYHDNSGRIN